MALIDVIFIPSEVKFAFSLTADGFSMDDDDFKVVIQGSKSSVTLAKADCFDDGAGNWFFAFDSAEVGQGQPTGIFTAYVPDADFPDGFRTEVDKILLPVYIRV